MKAKVILVISTLIFTLWWICVISFVALPLVLYSGVVGLIARLFIACIVFFLIWLAIMVIQQKKYAWVLGMVVYGIPVLLSLLSFFDLVAFFVLLSPVVSDSDSYHETATQLIGVASLGILVICAYISLYLNKSVRLLFKEDEVKVNEITEDTPTH